eukprot:COSAG05_NODE_754_length_7519_cov_4.955256_6_plen_79_part_00
MLNGFKKSYWKSSTGNWQRFGPGFYFALQASKSHTYPLATMRALGPGTHRRRMIMCTYSLPVCTRTQRQCDTRPVPIS